MGAWRLRGALERALRPVGRKGIGLGAGHAGIYLGGPPFRMQSAMMPRALTLRTRLVAERTGYIATSSIARLAGSPFAGYMGNYASSSNRLGQHLLRARLRSGEPLLRQ